MYACVLIPRELSLVLTLHPNPMHVLEMSATVWSNAHLSPGSVFYPEEGEVRVDRLETKALLRDDDIRRMYGCYDLIINVDGQEVRHCNWVRFVQSTTDPEAANIISSKARGQVFFQVVRPIRPNEEIVVLFHLAAGRTLNEMTSSNLVVPMVPQGFFPPPPSYSDLHTSFMMRRQDSAAMLTSTPVSMVTHDRDSSLTPASMETPIRGREEPSSACAHLKRKLKFGSSSSSSLSLSSFSSPILKSIPQRSETSAPNDFANESGISSSPMLTSSSSSREITTASEEHSGELTLATSLKKERDKSASNSYPCDKSSSHSSHDVMSDVKCDRPGNVHPGQLGTEKNTPGEARAHSSKGVDFTVKIDEGKAVEDTGSEEQVEVPENFLDVTDNIGTCGRGTSFGEPISLVPSPPAPSPAPSPPPPPPPPPSPLPTEAAPPTSEGQISSSTSQSPPLSRSPPPSHPLDLNSDPSRNHCLPGGPTPESGSTDARDASATFGEVTQPLVVRARDHADPAVTSGLGSPVTSTVASAQVTELKVETTTKNEDVVFPTRDAHAHMKVPLEEPIHQPLEISLMTSHPAHPIRRCRERTWWPCDVCGKKFDRPSLLKRHTRTHTGEKPHACDVCGKAFSTSSSLNTHRRIHSGEKPHQCKICGKRFTASSNLYYHRMTHNKEKPHKCDLCSKSFPTPGDLRSHMYIHNGSWPFRCHVCNRGFSKQTNLKNHMLLHSGDKPHDCLRCGKKFALLCNLKTHLKTHEQSDSSDVTECCVCGGHLDQSDGQTDSVCKRCQRSGALFQAKTGELHSKTPSSSSSLSSLPLSLTTPSSFLLSSASSTSLGYMNSTTKAMSGKRHTDFSISKITSSDSKYSTDPDSDARSEVIDYSHSPATIYSRTERGRPMTSVSPLPPGHQQQRLHNPHYNSHPVHLMASSSSSSTSTSSSSTTSQIPPLYRQFFAAAAATAGSSDPQKALWHPAAAAAHLAQVSPNLNYGAESFLSKQAKAQGQALLPATNSTPSNFLVNSLKSGQNQKLGQSPSALASLGPAGGSSRAAFLPVFMTPELMALRGGGGSLYPGHIPTMPSGFPIRPGSTPWGAQVIAQGF